MPETPERIELAPQLDVSRIVTGLWQVADMERDGRPLDPEAAAAAMLDYARAGFDSFDMADHYGSAEVIAGRFLARAAGGDIRGAHRPVALTKWCPAPGPMTMATVRSGVERSLRRLGVKTIDLLQFHWWSFEHPAYLDAMKALDQLRGEGLIRHLGVTNFDTGHLRVLVKHGIKVVSNQISFSLLDRRAAGEMSAFCLANGVRLLAYGTLAGGLLSERWLGAKEPASDEIADWSKMKYKRFVDAVGGWTALQAILSALNRVAAPSSRVDRQCGDALDARTSGRGRRHRRRPPRRAAAYGRQCKCFFLCAGRRRSRDYRRGAGEDGYAARRLRR